MAVEPDWPDAACRDADPELFFHPDGEAGKARRERTEAAQAYCRTCRIQADCLQFALATLQDFGIWGGQGENQRKTLLRNDAPGVTPLPLSSEFEDSRDTTVIALLVAGADALAPDRIDVAHAAVQLHGLYGDTSRVALQLGVTGDQVRKWVRRDRLGEPLVNPEWLAAERRRKARIQRAVAA